jgi:hypothetical protein
MKMSDDIYSFDGDPNDFAEEEGTHFFTKCQILGELYHSNIKLFREFIEYNDIGLPLAYFNAEGLVMVRDDGIRFIQETWDLFLAELGLDDIGFETLDEVLELFDKEDPPTV